MAGAGMVLEKPVLRNNGQVLVGSGTELTESLLDRLEKMEVEWLTVQGNPVNMEGMGTSSYQDRIKALDKIFRQHKQDPWMMKMKKFLQGYFKRKAAQQTSMGPAKDTETEQN